jgi:hypothetical protein
VTEQLNNLKTNKRLISRLFYCGFFPLLAFLLLSTSNMSDLRYTFSTTILSIARLFLLVSEFHKLGMFIAPLISEALRVFHFTNMYYDDGRGSQLLLINLQLCPIDQLTNSNQLMYGMSISVDSPN